MVGETKGLSSSFGPTLQLTADAWERMEDQSQHIAMLAQKFHIFQPLVAQGLSETAVVSLYSSSPE